MCGIDVENVKLEIVNKNVTNVRSRKVAYQIIHVNGKQVSKTMYLRSNERSLMHREYIVV